MASNENNENNENGDNYFQSGGYIKINELTDLIESTKNHEDDFEKLAVPVLMQGLTTTPNKINPQKLFFHGVYKMIEGAEKIECISWKSLYGFIFSVEVPNATTDDPNNRLYFKNGNIGKTTAGARFSEYITKILLKFAFTSNSTGKVTPDFKIAGTNEDIKKYTIEKANFLKEAQTQSKMNGSTCTTRLSICPDVLDFSLMDSETALKIIEMMKTKSDETTQNVLTYMMSVISSQNNLNYGLGMMSMEYANNFKTYYQMEQENQNNTNVPDLTILILANMVWLFTTGYIHLDLHKQNILICSDGGERLNSGTSVKEFNNEPFLNLNKICVWLIDMGRVIDIKKKTEQEPLTKITDYLHMLSRMNDARTTRSNQNKQDIINLYNEANAESNTIDKYDDIVSEIKKYVNDEVKSILKKIIEEDIKFMKNYQRIPQCSYLIQTLNDNINNKKIQESFPKEYNGSMKQYVDTIENMNDESIQSIIDFLLHRQTRDKDTKSCITSTRYEMSEPDTEFYKLSYLGNFRDFITDKPDLLDIKSNTGLDNLITAMGGTVNGVQTYLSQINS